ncbi:MAG: vitamin B12 dependent-methionine synthase activation domain-containing protein, partial [Neglectibacter sp.]
LYLRPRYSPGYGDFSLENQRFFFDSLEITKRIGVFLTDSFLMIPCKSITAVLGLSEKGTQCHVGKCMSCKLNKCPFRK